MSTRPWESLLGADSGRAAMENTVRDMVSQTEVPQLFAPRSIPGSRVNFADGFPGTIGKNGAVPAGSILTAHIADSAITSAKILDGTIVTGDIADNAVTAAKLTTVPACRVYRTATQSISNGGSGANINFNLAADFDTTGSSMHSSSVNNTRITAPVAGIYVVTAAVEWAASAAGQRDIAILKNGVAQIAVRLTGHATVQVKGSVTDVLSLAANDYVEVYVYQDSGASLNVVVANFAATYIGRAS